MTIIPNANKKIKALAELVIERKSKVAGKKFVLPRTELKSRLGNQYAEVVEMCSHWLHHHKEEGWTSSSEVWESNGFSTTRRDGSKASWKGKAKLFSITNYEILQDILDTELPENTVSKPVNKEKAKSIASVKRMNKHRAFQALDPLQQMLVTELRTFWKKSGRKLKDFHFTCKDGRIYSSVHSLSQKARTECFVQEMGMDDWDGISFHPFLLALDYQRTTGHSKALDAIRTNDFYTVLGYAMSELEPNPLSSSSFSLSQNETTFNTFPRKNREKTCPKSVTQLTEEQKQSLREKGKETMNHLLNASHALPNTRKAFVALDLETFYNFIQTKKKKARKLQSVDGKKGLGLYCQELEEQIIRKTIGKTIMEKGFNFIDLHDGFYTNAPQNTVEEIILSIPDLAPEDFKHNGQQINRKPSKAPEQIEAISTPPKEEKALESLLLAPEPNLFQADKIT